MSTTRGRTLSLLLLFVLTLLVMPVAFAKDVVVHMVQNPTLGNILVDSNGNTLYRFTKDTVNVSSACYDKCATSWPPLLVDSGSNPAAGDGVDGNLLGVLTRKDGTRQVMYNGMPLYYFGKDTKPGDVNGQDVGKVWFIVHPTTTTVANQSVVVKASQNAALGSFLTDGAGRTLYQFMKDSANQSVCYDQCATFWPPLLVGTTAATLDGISGNLGTTVRNDGNNQVTYEGKPLYYFIKDANPGDTKGQGVGNVWFVIAPAAASAPANPPAAPAPAPSSAPTSLPNTGAGEATPLTTFVLLALLVIALGALVLLRYRRHRA